MDMKEAQGENNITYKNYPKLYINILNRIAKNELLKDLTD